MTPPLNDKFTHTRLLGFDVVVRDRPMPGAETLLTYQRIYCTLTSFILFRSDLLGGTSRSFI